MTQELLELLWVLEATVSLFPPLEEMFNEVVRNPTFPALELSVPTAEQRQPPAEQEGVEDPQPQLPM